MGTPEAVPPHHSGNPCSPLNAGHMQISSRIVSICRSAGPIPTASRAMIFFAHTWPLPIASHPKDAARESAAGEPPGRLADLFSPNRSTGAHRRGHLSSLTLFLFGVTGHQAHPPARSLATASCSLPEVPIPALAQALDHASRSARCRGHQTYRRRQHHST